MPMWCDCPQCSWEYQPDEREEDAAEEREEYQPDEREEDAAEEREAQAAEEANERAQARYERGIYGE